MSAPKGNTFHLLRVKVGRDTEYTSEEEIARVANDYFEQMDASPLIAIDFKGKDAVECELPKMKPYSLEGLCLHMHICMNTFRAYEKKEAFMNVCARIRKIIDTQQYEGAAAGFLNANIVSRKIGLAEKQEVEHKGEGAAGAFKVEIVPPDAPE